jgi:hypothetical protein
MLKNKEIGIAIILGVSCALLLLGISYVVVPNEQSHTLGTGNSDFISATLPTVFGIALVTIVAIIAVAIFITISKLKKTRAFSQIGVRAHLFLVKLT